MTRITLHARAGRLGNLGTHTGYIVVYAGNDRLYSKSTGINRVTRAYALGDAAQLKADFLTLNPGT